MYLKEGGMPDEEDEHFELLIEEAEKAAEDESKTLSGRVKTAAFFTARKQLKKGPARVVTAALEHIPFVGPKLGAASGTLQGIVRNKRVKKKGLHAVCTATYTSSSAKDCAKALGLLARQKLTRTLPNRLPLWRRFTTRWIS